MGVFIKCVWDVLSGMQILRFLFSIRRIPVSLIYYLFLVFSPEIQAKSRGEPHEDFFYGFIYIGIRTSKNSIRTNTQLLPSYYIRRFCYTLWTLNTYTIFSFNKLSRLKTCH